MTRTATLESFEHRIIQLPTSGGGEKVEEHIFYVPIPLLPSDLPTDPNPRNPNTTKSIWKNIRKNLYNEDTPSGLKNVFHLMNKGISISAESCTLVETKNAGEIWNITFGKGDGIMDGGHTYSLLSAEKENLTDVIPGDDGNIIQNDLDQYVKVLVYTGLDESMRIAMAEGLNTAVQVQDYSLEHLRGEFDWIKDICDSAKEHVAYCENDYTDFGKQKHYAVKSIVQLIFPFAGIGNPMDSYSSKQKPFDLFIKKVESFKKLSGIFEEIVELSETIQVCNSVEIDNRRKQDVIDCKKRGYYQYPFISKYDCKKKLCDSAHRPILAAFVNLTDDVDGEVTWKCSFKEILEVWDIASREMVEEARSHLNNGKNYIAKNKRVWANMKMILDKKARAYFKDKADAAKSYDKAEYNRCMQILSTIL